MLVSPKPSEPASALERSVVRAHGVLHRGVAVLPQALRQLTLHARQQPRPLRGPAAVV